MGNKATPLTESQKRIIRENYENMMDRSICALPGMEGTTARQVKDYRLKVSKPQTTDAAVLASALEDYISSHGLPARYGAVIPYISYLRAQS